MSNQRRDRGEFDVLVVGNLQFKPGAGDINKPSAKKTAIVALGALDTGGGVLSWKNPEGVAIGITRLTIRTTVKSTAASTVDFGTTATSATTSSDNLMDGVDTGTAVVYADNYSLPGTNGKATQLLAADTWVTGSKASGACAGLVGFAYIEYMVL